MKLESRHDNWNYKLNSKTVRLDRSFDFDTSEDSERFAESLGTAISFPNLAVYIDPVVGLPKATVTIECSDDSVNLANAALLLDSFEGLHRSC
jgi:hypothetical protein